MRYWRGLQDVPRDWGASVVTIGVFDGVHRGHQVIVGRAAESSARLGLPVVVVTFDPHPDEVVRPGPHPAHLCTVARRAELLTELGADAVCVIPFSREFSQLGPEEFVRVVLVDSLHAALAVVGDNFRFGHRAAGDVALLAELGEKYDFAVDGVPLLADGGAPITSTRIRELLAEGDAAAAAELLGRPHRVEGVVVRGHRRGGSLGFPTANLEAAAHTAIPGDGVYAGWLTRLDPENPAQERWPAAISVGTNPTFGPEERSVEAYVLDRDDLDLYGWRVAADFAVRLRGQERFDSVPELIAQMHRDVDAARALLSAWQAERARGSGRRASP
jgi:riboflavin kinase / FMN adenylyltransferase